MHAPSGPLPRDRCSGERFVGCGIGKNELKYLARDAVGVGPEMLYFVRRLTIARAGSAVSEQHARCVQDPSGLSANVQDAIQREGFPGPSCPEAGTRNGNVRRPPSAVPGACGVHERAKGGALSPPLEILPPRRGCTRTAHASSFCKTRDSHIVLGACLEPSARQPRSTLSAFRAVWHVNVMTSSGGCRKDVLIFSFLDAF